MQTMGSEEMYSEKEEKNKRERKRIEKYRRK
jgi:hypothetical protein